MIEHIKNAAQNIVRKKMRSSFTILGITIGVMSVVVISMISDIGKRAINQELSDMGAGGMLISANAEVSKDMFNQNSLDEIRHQTSVLGASPLMVQHSRLKVKENVEECMMWGIDEDITKIIALKMLHGRMINQTDVDEFASVCVVDEQYAKQTYHRSNIVGKKIDLLMDGRYRTFEVVGVIQSSGNVLQSLIGNITPCFTYLPYTSMQVLLNQPTFKQIVAKGSVENTTPMNMNKILGQAMDDYFQIDNSVKIEDLNNQISMVNSVMDVISGVLTVIAGLSLLVSGLSIMTIMLVSVHERTREIGIKKSIGASRLLILSEFLMESFLVSFMGSIVGILLALIIVGIGCMIFGMFFYFNFTLVVSCIFFTLFVGVLFGAYPAFKAASLRPVDALRQE